VVGYRIAGRSFAEVAAEVERRFSLSGGDAVLGRLKTAVLDRVHRLVELHGGS
jgi:hypothetical protein